MSLPPLDAHNFDAERQHWLPVRVYYEDTDFTGMVYHANYLRFFERGRSDHLRDAGVSHQSLLAREDPAAFTLTNVNVTYRKPGKVDDLLHIRTRYLGMDGPRIRFSQACLRGGELIAEAEITAVMIHADGRLRRPIKEIAEHLEAYRWRG
ncbi:MAG: YbgC/FadM family acyl-CoA thioesterase [Hyphomonas sp.]|uniref:YbgC/FadM family acyl-CoA thioesterase n=1 Tax=Hyphomonas sp. TaxID=87 RepID=UPI0017B7114A|nr:YbgC/FadM family acyl-CoA thioesterase [Hyphomonas sp.]MBU3922221.1 YbgC/FadM family acyl-CoA thioesterase [Alphaproteobacteria bacterium]MBA3069036.1 YbgC/FadM family acyl-CoA thioesterase [Hyphomonas sp.]MBU4061669.1 YbgC/FadM family acyl-CoA thioesterase [Alphaproteobacteria bacterium]MBU4163514.1 YbgC/FadM family acyl-CoA thioesterase [Alphaproteobacteria bacterium]MBU4567662.1 YbgC/FadM family acyl-CoA thioesterase [Alphaproteobacteria bacterium]